MYTESSAVCVPCRPLGPSGLKTRYFGNMCNRYCNDESQLRVSTGLSNLPSHDCTDRFLGLDPACMKSPDRTSNKIDRIFHLSVQSQFYLHLLLENNLETFLRMWLETGDLMRQETWPDSIDRITYQVRLKIHKIG